MDVPPALARHRRDVEAFLRTLLDRPGAPLLYQMARYHLGWEDESSNPSDAGGKGVRGGLCLLACEASDGAWQKALPAAAAVELVHAFSLVHDDIQDRDRERHHRPTVWAVWGEAQAINAGDALLALARLSLVELTERGVPSESVLRAGRSLDEATLEMVEGQVLDLEYEGRADVSVEEYLDMVGCKTGALFACALSLGAIVAGSNEERVEEFRRIGRLLGVAFQVCDDVLGIWGDERKTGKPAGADLRQRKKSLPVVMALNGPNADLIRGTYAEGPQEYDVGALVLAMEEAGIPESCQQMAESLGREALASVAAMELAGEGGRELAEAVGFLLERDF